MRKTWKRALKIKTLRHIDCKAGRLAKAHLKPVAAYGVEAIGASPSTRAKMTYVFGEAFAPRSNAPFKRAAAIHLELGPDHDPEVAMFKQQVTFWVQHQRYNKQITHEKMMNRLHISRSPLQQLHLVLAQLLLILVLLTSVKIEPLPGV